jgi:hypothetical protein
MSFVLTIHRRPGPPNGLRGARAPADAHGTCGRAQHRRITGHRDAQCAGQEAGARAHALFVNGLVAEWLKRRVTSGSSMSESAGSRSHLGSAIESGDGLCQSVPRCAQSQNHDLGAAANDLSRFIRV